MCDCLPAGGTLAAFNNGPSAMYRWQLFDRLYTARLGRRKSDIALTVNPRTRTPKTVCGSASVFAQLHLTPQRTLIGKFDGEFADFAQTYPASGTLRYT